MSKQKEWERRRLERLAKEAGKAPPVRLVEDEVPPGLVDSPTTLVTGAVVEEIEGRRELVEPLDHITGEDAALDGPNTMKTILDPEAKIDPLQSLRVELQIERGRVAELQKENATLARWKKEQLEVASWWDKIDAYVRAHPSCVAGSIVADEALRLLKERDALMAKPDEKFIPSDRDLMLNSDKIWKSYIATPAGKALTDPRLPSDYGRLIGVLEDRAKAAFTAGMGVGR